MRILIDTNIILQREDNRIIPQKVIDFFNKASEHGLQIVVHPLADEDISHDTNAIRKNKIESKVLAYKTLESPPSFENDTQFLQQINVKTKDKVDNSLLYSVFKNAVDVLVTEDKGILKKANILKLTERVLNLDEVVIYLHALFPQDNIDLPTVSFSYLPIHNVSIDDKIFSKFKKLYPKFEKWWETASKNGRKGYFYIKPDKTLGALMVLKRNEQEVIDAIPVLPIKKRLKICTLRVVDTGFKIGEAFIKMATRQAIDDSVEEMYLTIFESDDENLKLISLIKELGFQYTAKMNNGEHVYVKKFCTSKNG